MTKFELRALGQCCFWRAAGVTRLGCGKSTYVAEEIYITDRLNKEIYNIELTGAGSIDYLIVRLVYHVLKR